MIRPASSSIQIVSRSDFDFTITVYASADNSDPNNTADLTNTTILSQLWDFARQNKYADFTVDMSRADDGVVGFSLTSVQTADLPTTGAYDVKIIYPDNKEYYLLRGTFSVLRGYTDD